MREIFVMLHFNRPTCSETLVSPGFDSQPTLQQPHSHKGLSVLRYFFAVCTLLAFHCAFAAVSATLPLPPPVRGFPPGIVNENMVRALETFNRVYGRDVIIDSIDFDGRVQDVDSTVEEMMKTIAIPGRDTTITGVHTKIYGPADATVGIPQDRIDLFKDSLRLNLGLGDFRILVALHNVHDGKAFVSLNSMQSEGRRFSGTFLGTARVGTTFGSSVRLKNTVCHHEVATTYLWGSEAESFDGCVRAVCSASTVTDCRVTYSKANPGFLAEARILPDSGTLGTVVGNCCDGYFAWAWAVGFESISVAAGGKSFAISGVGESGNGSFTVTECCNGGIGPLGQTTPSRGQPNTSQTFSSQDGGYTRRFYGGDGRAVKDVDYGHDHGAGDPHIHDWDWSTEPPTRKPGRSPRPGELAPPR